jgi:putative endopeptidase
MSARSLPLFCFFVLATSWLTFVRIEETEAMQSMYGRWGFDLEGMNLAIRPGDSFYRYANGTYLDKLVIPPERSVYTAGSALTDAVLANVRAMLEDPAQRESGVGSRLAADYYASFMDEARIDHLGLAPLLPEMDSIRAGHTRADLASQMGQANAGFFGSVFSLEITPDLKDPTRYAIQIGQPDLGLPARGYYLDAGLAAERHEYKLYIAKLLKLAGWPKWEDDADNILSFETAIAAASWGGEQKRDPEATYHPMTPQQLERSAPGFPWTAFLNSAGVGGENQLIVAEKDAVTRIAALYAETPLQTLRAWEVFAVLDHAAPYLSKDFRDAAFAFHDRVLAGRKQPAERWKQALRLVGSANGMSHIEAMANLGDAVSELYVARYFQPQDREQVEVIVANVKTALHRRIDSLAWMEPATKKEALEKLRKYTIEIGYPDRWRHYNGLHIDAGDLVGNIRRTAAFNWQFKVARLRAPVDRGEWPVEPHVVNAYNNGVLHQIVFTAAVLRPPVFDPKADPAVNYGAIGAIIGHELTHGFDDQGRRFDSDGRLRDWWGFEDTKRFQEKAAQLGAQFDRCEALPGMHVNGQLTMGENLADLGGLVLALDAYHASLNGQAAPLLDGLTGDQRFFLSYAQQRRGKYTEQALRQQILSDPHSPDECRVNVEVRNLDAWYAAFSVAKGDRLYLDPKDRVSLW